MTVLQDLIRALPQNAEVLDYGCFGWSLHADADNLGRRDLLHSGSDIKKPAVVPDGTVFYAINPDTSAIAAKDDAFDLIVVSHVLEHVPDPIKCFGEIARICKPGGRIYVETPSDRSVRVRGACDPENHAFLSFWDDPTHIRPWTPAALYRLGISYGFAPRKCGYAGTVLDKILFPFRYVAAKLRDDGDKLTECIWSANKWACHAVFEKPKDTTGKPEYRYISLRGVPKGVENALKFYESLKHAP